MTKTVTGTAIGGTSRFIDDRLGSGNFIKRNMRKAFPDHWSFLLGEIALYSFVILLLTGTFLTFWFRPSMRLMTYTGSYAPLKGVQVSEAYNSALHISFDVRGGLLVRQLHHWAAILFVAAMMAHLLRIFFTGAYRKPRELNWLIGLVMFTLAIVEGLLGYTLPDDLLSGTGMRITQGVLQSIPLVGTYLYYFLFGGPLPGQDFIPRIFTIHILLLPGLFLALITAHMMIMWHQKHTAFPAKGQSETKVTGYPFYPVFMAKTGAFFLFTFTVLTLLSTFAQINPIWLFGPYNPSQISAGSQPDFYMGFLEGSLRMMPNWETNLWGHTIPWNVLLPAAVPMGIIFTVLGAWPFLEQWITGDKREHHILQRPRNAPTRTAIGMAGVVFYGVLWLAGGNDIIATHFNIALFATTQIFRVLLFVGPVAAYIITKRICLGLQRRDRGLIEHGVETGIIRRLPSGEYIEVERPLNSDGDVLVRSKTDIAAYELPVADEHGIPAPETRGPAGKLRARLNRVWTSDDIPFEGVGNGHGNGHADHGEHAAVGAGDGQQAIEGGEEGH